MKPIAHDTIYTNVALTDDATFGGGRRPTSVACVGELMIDAGIKRQSCIRMAGFTTPMRNNPALDPTSKKAKGADQRYHFRRTPSDRAAGVSGLRLEPRLSWRYHGFGDNRSGHRAVGQAPRSDGDVAVLRIQHRDYFQHWLEIGKTP